MEFLNNTKYPETYSFEKCISSNFTIYNLLLWFYTGEFDQEFDQECH